MTTSILKVSIASAAMSLAVAGCTEPADSFTPEELAAARTAVPSATSLEAPAPVGSLATAAGDPALYPAVTHDAVVGINGAVAGIVTIMKTIVEFPPTAYNAETREFVWGPFDSDDGVGTVAAYVRDEGDQADFRYTYALLRGADRNLDDMTPVIFGGATPDPTDDERGFGITLWDFEADREFRQANDPAFADDVSRGRFVAVYGRMQDDSDASAEIAFVVAVFRNFIPEDKLDDPAVDLDFFYGRHQTAEHTLDFVDLEATIDVSEPTDGVLEDVGVRLAFLDEGTGRAEADARNGSLPSNERFAVTECWNRALNRTFLEADHRRDDASVSTSREGERTECGDVFSNTLTDLSVPSLDDVDGEMRGALSDAAETGLGR